MSRLLAPILTRAAADRLLVFIGGRAVKTASDATPTISLAGRLYLSQSGWLLLAVPAGLVRGAFEALDENGVELPLRDGVLQPHISVMSAKEVESLGGGDKITERGKMFKYQLGPVKHVDPTTWDGVSRVWYLTIFSPELKELRKSYGLTPLPHGDWDFHVTFAVRKTGVLGKNEISKASQDLDPSYSAEHPEECCPKCGARQEQNTYDEKCNRCGDDWPKGESAATSGIAWTLAELRKAFREAAEAHRTVDENDAGIIDIWVERSGPKIRVNTGDWCTREAHQAYRDVANRFGEADMVNEAGLPDKDLWTKVYPEQEDLNRNREHYKSTHKEAGVVPFRPLNAEPDFIAANQEWHDAERARIAASRQQAAAGKAGSGDMLAFKAWKELGLSDEEADRMAGTGSLPGDEKVTPRIKQKKVVESEIDICPHCNEEIREKSVYVDEDGYEFHRPCAAKGAIGRLNGRLRSLLSRTQPKDASLATEIDAAAAACEEPKSEEQARAGNYRKGHCTVHGLPITIETAKGMTRKGTDKNGKPWQIEMKAHYGYIKRTKSEADQDHLDVFLGPEPESEIVFVVDQYIDGKFDESKFMLGYKTKEDAKAGYLANYADGWQGCGAVSSLTLPQFKEWIASGDTSKPLAGQKIEVKAARVSNTLAFMSTLPEPVASEPEPVPQVDMLQLLLAAKQRSRARRYREKHRLLRQAMQTKPEEFVVDQPDAYHPGITHVPTNFRIHTSRRTIPARVRRKAAAPSHVSRAVRSQPIVWRGDIGSTLLAYLQQLGQRSQQEIAKAYNTDRIRQQASPDYRWQQARATSQGLDNVVTHPLDRIVQGLSGGTR